MAQKETSAHIPIIADIRRKAFKPVYLLMGEEPYYIDLITEEIIRHALKDEDRDFNQTIVYGADNPHSLSALSDDVGTTIGCCEGNADDAEYR